VEPDGAAAPGGLRLSPLPSTSNAAKFDLTLFMFAHPDGLSGALEYNTDLFDAATIGRLAGHFTNLLQGMVAQPEVALATLPLLDAKERHQLLCEWNRSAASLQQVADEYRRRGAVLPPLGDAEVLLLDSHLQPVPIGVPGELFLGGDGIAEEYLDHPGFTEESLVPHPFGPQGRRLYRTGDRVRRLADGKLDFLADRGELPAPAGAPVESLFVAPRTAVEEVMAGLFAEILGGERVGVRDNFFALGGHSLLATRLMMKLRSVFGVEVPLRALFESPTVEGMCAAFAAAAGGMEILEEIAQVYLAATALSEEEIAQLLGSGEDPQDEHGQFRAETYG
jgi:acyl carrier protein